MVYIAPLRPQKELVNIKTLLLFVWQLYCTNSIPFACQQPHVDRIRNNENDINKCKQHIRPFLYCICLMGAHSKYNTNARNAALFQMIINLLIQEAQRTVNPMSLFQYDADEGLLRIQSVLEVMDDFRWVILVIT